MKMVWYAQYHCRGIYKLVNKRKGITIYFDHWMQQDNGILFWMYDTPCCKLQNDKHKIRDFGVLENIMKGD